MVEPTTIEGEAQEVMDEVEEAARNLPAVQQHEAIVARQEISVDEMLAQREKIEQAMQRGMKEGVHYGRIPGIDKPSLYKPGGEYLNVLFRLSPSYRSEKTWHDDGHLTVTAVCTLTHIPTGLVIAEGEGLCTTRESRYAYRGEGRTCPVCGKAGTIKKSKFAPRSGDYDGASSSDPPGWYCHAKVGGCGQNFPHDDPSITSQSGERIPNPDLADTYNTVLKMADKRAMLAAVLNGTAASDVFTQDAEDSAPGSAASESGNTGAETAAGPVAGAGPTVTVGPPDSFPAGADLGLRLREAFLHIDSSVDWAATWESANVALYGSERASLTDDQKSESMYRIAWVAATLTEGGDFPPPVESEIQAAFAEHFEGVAADVIYLEAPTTDNEEPYTGPDNERQKSAALTPEEQARLLAASDEDIPF